VPTLDKGYHFYPGLVDSTQPNLGNLPKHQRLCQW